MASSARFRLSGWDLSELSNGRDLDHRLEELEALVDAFEARRGELEADVGAELVEELVALYEEIVSGLVLLSSYAALRFSENTQSPVNLALKGRMQQVRAELGNRTLFFGLWWKALPDEKVEALLPADPDRRHFLLDMRRTRRYALEERNEQIINLKDVAGQSVVMTLFSILLNRMQFELEIEPGRVEKMSRDQLMSHAFSPSADRREQAFRELFRVFDTEATPLGEIYVSRVRDWHNENVRLRGYATPISVRNVENDVSDLAVSTLLEVVHARRGIFHRYFDWKATALGLPRLRRFDVYAPVAASDRKIPYHEAVPLVLDTFESFDPEVRAMAERVFTSGHVDSELRPGKRAGAFCATVLPSQAPWVLVNYTDTLRDVMTIAHELGHAIHSLLAAEHSVLTQHAPLPLAETASVFAEMLLTERLLAEEEDPSVQRAILVSVLDHLFATVLRQTYFTRFEMEAHDRIREGATAADLDRLYLEQLAEQFGESVDLAQVFRREWIAIPHIFHTPFYCYAYSFGQLLVLSLFRRWQLEGDAFRPAYLRLLAHGGSAPPHEILAEIGVDIEDPSFWHAGCDLMDEMMARLEAL